MTAARFLFEEAEADYLVSLADAQVAVRFTQMTGAAPTLITEHRAKALGAYYTDSQVADFLVWWAIRDAGDTVMDPSFGGGVFLRSASKRLLDLGGESTQVFGVEIASDVHTEISALLRREFGIKTAQLALADFFDVTPGRLPKVEAVVGNPPFIRYQRFSGEARKRALTRAAEEGLKLNGMASSWLPFLVHSIRFLQPGGRLAMVIPFEIGHAAYARRVLEHLAKRFESVTFLTFRRKLFADLSEDTLLLLAEGRRDSAQARFQLRDLAHAGSLTEIQSRERSATTGLRNLNSERIVSGQERLIESLIPARSRDLYRELRGQKSTVRLGNLADVGIGYVTGANNFFHLSPEEVRERSMPSRFLRPCVRRGRAFAGLRFTTEDWNTQLGSGETGYLMELPAKGSLPDAVRRYLTWGEQAEVHKTFKCRNRTPWYRVPHVYQPDGFLTYMSGDFPRLVANDAGVVAPNNLHVLRMHPEARIAGDALAALWQTSLTHLSVEIEGHSLGGGMLKLEPTEAEQVLLPFVPADSGLESLAQELDHLARKRGKAAAHERADEALLRDRIGLTAKDVRLLRQAAESLHERRTKRST